MYVVRFGFFNMLLVQFEPNWFCESVLFPLVLAFITALVFGKFFINFLSTRFLKKGQPIRSYGPLTHMSKQGTPNMGGFIIFAPVYAMWPFVGDIKKTWFFMIPLLIFNALGFVDDYLKATRRNVDGVRPRTKLIVQFAAAAIFVACANANHPAIKSILIPFYGHVNFGIWGLAFGVVTIVAASNSVNLTDGLDGLVSTPIISNSAFLLYAATISGIAVFTPGLTAVTSTFIGGALGFLWYNAHPAQVFMGDNGSLASGAFIGFMSVFLSLEFLLIISGFLFVIEAGSVILQLAYFRKTKGRRLFLMTPIHHHFEQIGIHETTIAVRMGIFSAVCALFAVALLKITT